MYESFSKVMEGVTQDGNLDTSQESGLLSYDEQSGLASQMVPLKAKGSVVEAIRRSIALSRNMSTCNYLKDESCFKYTERFRGVAQAHLGCHPHTLTEPEKQHVAMILLGNGDLLDSVHNNILSILTALYKVRK